MLSSKRLEDIFTRRLEDVLKTVWTCLEDIFARRLADVLKMSWWRFYKSLEDVLVIRLEDVFKTYGQDEYIGLDEDVLKTSSEEHDYSEYIRLDQDVLKTSWRLLQDIFWRRRQKANVCWVKMLDVDNLAPVSVDLKKLSDVVDNDVAEKTVYNELVKKVNSSQTTDTSDSVKKKRKTQKLVNTKENTWLWSW